MYENLDQHDLSQIFTESVLLYEKQPVYIRGVDEENKLKVEVFGTRKRFDVPATDKRFDFTPIPLGMCNCTKRAVFLSRVPKRQFKQGLSSTNLLVTTLEGNKERNELDEIWDRSTTYLQNTVNGLYPTIKEALGVLDTGMVDSLAFHRFFAINADHELFYKTKRVGMYNRKKNEFLFSKSKEFLLEVLDYA